MIWVLVVIVLALLVFRNVVAILIEHLIPRAGGLLHCPEPAAPFLAIWYLLGMLVPTAIGAWLGPRLLRW